MIAPGKWNLDKAFQAWLISKEYAVMEGKRLRLWIPDGVACYMHEAYCAGKLAYENAS